jgi:hypothetical protein
VAAVTVAFVYTLATAPTIVLVLPTVSQAGQTSQAQLQANDPRTPTSSLQWRGCLICRCRPDMGLVDCTGKIMSDGRLPDVESFPTNTSTYNFGDCGVNHVDYDYFLAFPTIAVMYGYRISYTLYCFFSLAGRYGGFQDVTGSRAELVRLIRQVIRFSL